jgi:gamma-glutamyltranspeptidase/glutathione hydrolase
MRQILQPAISLAENGFAVHHVAAQSWKTNSECLMNPANKHGHDMLLEGKPPREGDVMKMPHLAETFKVHTTSYYMAGRSG